MEMNGWEKIAPNSGSVERNKKGVKAARTKQKLFVFTYKKLLNDIRGKVFI